jgi:DNA polymerase-3 subunit alpha
MFLIIDTETTGLPEKYDAPVSDVDNWPRLVQLAWQLYDSKGELIGSEDYIVKPEGFTIPYNAQKVHGISTERALEKGKDLNFVLGEFAGAVERSSFIIGHNIDFDKSIIGAEYVRTKIPNQLFEKTSICTKEESTGYCAIPDIRGDKYKWPTLAELYRKLFNADLQEAHNASADVAATARCFFELLRNSVIDRSRFNIGNDILLKQNVKEESSQTESVEPEYAEAETSEAETSEAETEEAETAEDETTEAETSDTETEQTESAEVYFTHLHVHTQYSILDGAAGIKELLIKAREDDMKAMAITDHGNMFGVKEFHDEAISLGIKPILGCEVYVARRSRFDKADRTDGSGFHLVLLAKNKEGYQNLIKLVSYGWTEGFYYKPRVDKDLLRKYRNGLIACSACLKGEIPYTLKNKDYTQAKKLVLEYKDIFGGDFYLELQRHKTDDPQADSSVYQDQLYVNNQLRKLSEETGVKYIATNDVHFINREDARAHDILLCISTGKDINDNSRLRYTGQEWLKTRAEMTELFADLQDAITNTREIEEKIEDYSLDNDPIMPDFPIPEGVKDADEYLGKITWEGAKSRYPQISKELEERIEFELGTIKKMGYPGYFLIIWDVIRAAREMGVSVGPGRGSAAGSVVAYCLRITDIDPIKYNLLFERFLNPDRISMPDIDIDFDEDGREKVLQWIVSKYGREKVAHIITFGTMAPRMAIRDVARVLKLELPEADRLAKLVPEGPGVNFKKAYEESPDLAREKNSQNELIVQTLKYAEVLQGSVRQTGVHACGIIIGKNALEEHIPICINKDADLFVTQYDGKHVMSAGMLKMDFLGLKTLSIIKDTVANIKDSKGVDIDIGNIPLDDKKTFALYSKGETTGLFQFESDGMKKHLRALKPNRFEDLIAMNALYRPGPMEYIPNYTSRKHGKDKIVYDLPEMEDYLRDTYGITVYQEQVMLLSQKLAGFTKGMADSLRKAMGKKIKSMMDELQEKFIEGCISNGYDEYKARKIWKDWEAFALYAFNKSHSTCYAYVSYQTAYLKAHYPAEFMASVLSRNLSDIKKITVFMDECKRMGLKVLVPDINESNIRFTVNKDGNIRFGMAAIKGIGESAVQHIIEERNKTGPFKDIFDFVERVNLTTVNKRSIEALAMAGGFDSFKDIKRSQYFECNGNDISFIEHLIRYGNKIKSESGAEPTLFGDVEEIEVARPRIPDCDEWSNLTKLNKEKELIGIYLSAHPLDNYKLEIETFCNTKLSEFRNIENLKDREITIAGIVTGVKNALTKTGKPYGVFTLEDYSDSYPITLFGYDYENYRNYLYEGYTLLIKGNIQKNTWKNSGELEFKIKSIIILNNAREELIKSISIRIPLDVLSDKILNDIKSHIINKNGKTNLKFLIYDDKENISVEMFSRNYTIYPSNQFISYLENIPEIEYKVN